MRIPNPLSSRSRVDAAGGQCVEFGSVRRVGGGQGQAVELVAGREVANEPLLRRRVFGGVLGEPVGDRPGELAIAVEQDRLGVDLCSGVVMEREGDGGVVARRRQAYVVAGDRERGGVGAVGQERLGGQRGPIAATAEQDERKRSVLAGLPPVGIK
jgi:hypothetical protein